ncbi:hypothetical protein P7C70_g8702, partial [Phenoliferia sp. Uapishka_3]
MYPTPVPVVPGEYQFHPLTNSSELTPFLILSQAKFEPQAFRDQLIKHLESVPPGDFDAVASKLDVLGNQLDYRKYEQQLFEILLVGGLLAPGGGFAEDGAPKSTFSVVGAAKEPVDVADVQKIVDVFNKLMRRYKYLQKPFEETALKGILQYTNKFNPIEQEKLAVSTAVFVSSGLASASVLNVLKKEHLVKDCQSSFPPPILHSTADDPHSCKQRTALSVNFLVTFCKSYLLTESLEHLSASLRKGAVTNLESFLPASHQTSAEFSTIFKAAGLAGVVEFYSKQKTGQAKEETIARLKELKAEEADQEDIQSYLEAQHQRAVLPDTEFIALVWNGLLSSVDMATKSPEQVMKEINDIAPILEVFSTKPVTEVALINAIQLFCYENTKLMPAFPKILKSLYSKDVLSDQAIIYWHGKGAKPQAKATFLASAEPLVNFLKEQEEESDEDEE